MVRTFGAQPANRIGMNNNMTFSDLDEMNRQDADASQSVREYNLTHEDTAVIRDAHPGAGWNHICDLHPTESETVVGYITAFPDHLRPREMYPEKYGDPFRDGIYTGPYYGCATGQDYEVINIEVQCPVVVVGDGDFPRHFSNKSRFMRELIRCGFFEALTEEGWYIRGIHECYRPESSGGFYSAS